ncbi:IclR family transcriptional regulator [Horticoccus sp. 23ND18S-11]|uniref:IclR family transcriptional regulator n=1 Tax=Horticoccus sp. 23ND18S-11 TaxID=3391832 RepID=UPI0039C90C61
MIASTARRKAAPTKKISTARPPVAAAGARVQSVEKALRLLQLLDRHGDWIGVRELARQLALSPPVTHTLLKTLQAASFVEAHPVSRQYRLGLAALRLGGGVDPLQHMRRFARPYIESLAEKSAETIVVLAWQHEQAVVVDWIQAGHALAVTHRQGVIEHPMGLASGRVLLAFQDRATQERHIRREDEASPGVGVRNAAERLALLQRVAEEGIAITENIGQSGVVAIGAPVFEATGRLLFAVGCSAPLSRITPPQLRRLRERLLEITARMTKQLSASAKEA